jgi:opacity protein-like surface antigen
MKKFLFTFFSCQIFCLYADAATPQVKKPFTGIFFGAGGGASLLGGEHAYKIGADSGKLNMRGFGALLSAAAGYMWLTDTKAWFAGELYFYAKTAKSSKVMKNITNEGDVTIKNRSTLGIAGLLGGAVNPRLMMYAKAGFETGTFSFNYKNLTTPPNAKTNSTRMQAVVPGAGMLYTLTDAVLVGGEYGYMLSTKKLKASDASPVADYKPTEHRIMATIRYVF